VKGNISEEQFLSMPIKQQQWTIFNAMQSREMECGAREVACNRHFNQIDIRLNKLTNKKWQVIREALKIAGMLLAGFLGIKLGG